MGIGVRDRHGCHASPGVMAAEVVNMLTECLVLLVVAAAHAVVSIRYNPVCNFSGKANGKGRLGT